MRSGRVGKDGAKVKRVWQVIPIGFTAAGLKVLEGSMSLARVCVKATEGSNKPMCCSFSPRLSGCSTGSPVSSAEGHPCRPANRRIGCSFGGGAIHPTRPNRPWLARSDQPDRSVLL